MRYSSDRAFAMNLHATNDYCSDLPFLMFFISRNMNHATSFSASSLFIGIALRLKLLAMSFFL